MTPTRTFARCAAAALVHGSLLPALASLLAATLLTCADALAQQRPPGRGAKTPPEAAAPRGPRPYAPEAIGLGAEATRAHLAAALSLAREGRYADAIARLDALPKPSDAALAARFAAERMRLTAASSLIDDTLAQAMKTRRKLAVPYEGQVVEGRLQKVTEASLSIGSAREAVEVPRTALTPPVLHELAKPLLSGDRAWLGAWLQLLAGGGDAAAIDRSLQGDGEAAAALRAQRDEYAALAADAAPAHLLLSLASAPEPVDAAAARKLHEQLTQLLREHAANPLVQERREALRKLAEAVIERAFDPGRGECLGLHAQGENKGEGRIALTWTFADQAQVDDFVNHPRYATPLGEEHAGIEGSMTCTEGKLVAVGAVCRRLPLRLRVPLTVKATMTLFADGGFAIGCTDDGEFTYVSANPGGDIVTRSISSKGSGNQEIPGSDGSKFPVDKPIVLELRHDGMTLQCLVDGKVRGQAPNVGKYQVGGLFLWASTPKPVHVTKLEVEAALPAEDVPALREAWIAREMERLFGSR